jgi:small redox-active disulfide protein 2
LTRRTEEMKVEILGAGCAKCKRQTKNVERAIEALGIDAEVAKVEDYGEIADRGVMVTPAVTIDGELVSSGRVADVEELKELLASRVP